ncbi:MAG: hypothetical protein JNL13_13185 [Chitinophagaceae bacterium]|nr:hypothetical protein [Chitinophagaceae bacterium]
MTVEVFKTNMDCPHRAQDALTGLQSLFPDYVLSFDLEDCDRILKVATTGSIASEGILEFFRSRNYQIEVLV